MNYESSLVIFTTLTQLAVGLALFSAWKDLRHPAFPSQDGKGVPSGYDKGWLAVFLLASAGLVASLFHLAQPFRAAEALANLSVSWLSREALIFGLFTISSLVSAFYKKPWILVLTVLTGLAGIVAQGFTYASAAMPGISNGVPMFLFLLSAIAMGSAVGQIHASHRFSTVFRIACACLIAVLLITPCLWTSGGPVMQASAALWMQSWMFWAGLGCIAVAFLLDVCLTTDSSVPSSMAVICGVLLSRFIFFGGTVHTAMNLCMPY